MNINLILRCERGRGCLTLMEGVDCEKCELKKKSGDPKKLTKTNTNIIRSAENYSNVFVGNIRMIGLNYLNNSERIIVKNKGKLIYF